MAIDQMSSPNPNLVENHIGRNRALLHGPLNKGPPPTRPVGVGHEDVAVPALQLGEVLCEIARGIPRGAGHGVRVRNPVVEQDLLDRHRMKPLERRRQLFRLLDRVECTSVVAGEGGDAGRGAVGAESVPVHVQQVAGPGAPAEAAEVPLHLGVHFGQVVDMPDLDGFLAERGEGRFEMDRRQNGEGDGVDDALGAVDLVCRGGEGHATVSVHDGLDGAFETVLQTEADGVVEDAACQRGLALADLVERPALLEGFRGEALQGLGAEHFEEPDVLDRAAGAVRDQGLDQGQLVGGQLVADLLDAIAARELVDLLDLLGGDAQVAEAGVRKWTDVPAIFAVDVDEDPPGFHGHCTAFLERELSRARSGVEGEVGAATARGPGHRDRVLEAVALQLGPQVAVDV